MVVVDEVLDELGVVVVVVDVEVDDGGAVVVVVDDGGAAVVEVVIPDAMVVGAKYGLVAPGCSDSERTVPTAADAMSTATSVAPSQAPT